MRELSAETRSRNLEAMADRTFDVVVIGGGATGAGVAWDAASRGLSVALVEREDFAAGTSGRSSRLIHGGARYLRYGEFGVVAEGLRERRTLLSLAPHLVRPLPFLVPASGWWQRLQVRVGLTLYDALALGRNIRRHRSVGSATVTGIAPTLRRRQGAFLYWDCATDDARLVLEVLREAARHGALVANHAEVEAVLGAGTVSGIRIADRISGGRLEVRGRVVVNATGAWADRVRALSGPGAPRLRPSKGVHLVVPRERLPVHSAVLVPSVAGGDSLIFVIPWGPRTYAGTTDTSFEGDLTDPPVDPIDAEVLLRSLNRSFGGDLSAQDVVASWAGVRPLLASGSPGVRATRDLSRRHVVVEGPPGMITVTGGKLTAFRAMAEDVVDLVCRRLGRGGSSRTARLRIGLHRPLHGELDRAETEGARMGLSPRAARRLVVRYGDDWDAAVGVIRDEPDFAEPIVPGLPVLRVEAALARTREMALTDEDVLVRRTRLAAMDARAARERSSHLGLSPIGPGKDRAGWPLGGGVPGPAETEGSA